MRSLKYVALYMLVVQFALGSVVPIGVVYNYRMDYDVLKNNMDYVDPVLEQVRRLVRQKKLDEYIVILGDSVAYSGPGGPTQSVTYYLEGIARREGKPLPVFNFAIPAAQTGDVYTMILKLREYGISTDNLIVNLIYPGFVAREPGPPIVYWLADELRRLDPPAYEHVRKHLESNTENLIKLTPSEAALRRWVYPHLSILRYKDYLQAYAWKVAQGETKRGQVPVEPWFQKPWLKDAIRKPIHQKAYSDAPFAMDETNLNIYFINKIIELEADANLVFFLAPVNQVLMHDYVSRAGYQENLRRIDDYFRDKPVAFLNLESQLEHELFSDHVHLVPRGYERLAEYLWQAWRRGVD